MMSHLFDFRENLEKPSYRGLEGYQEKKPKGPFRMMANMIRKNVQVITAPYWVVPYIPKYLYYEGPVFRGFCKMFWTKDRRYVGTLV